MEQTNSRLTVAEKMLLERCSDLEITRRRVRIVVISGLLLAAALVVTAPLMASWEFLLFFAVAYILVTTWERVGYARTIMAYKGLALKLAARAAAIEDGGGEGPTVS
ncbi:MAG: hypothetical protein GTO46_13425 [Gemmatimonadetes bacterium]|nr:hypothetical protein [Gemmatimonadota bacterium]NIO32581.1 hypothetical protein [Gemmatimonadota bacterium]